MIIRTIYVLVCNSEERSDKESQGVQRGYASLAGDLGGAPQNLIPKDTLNPLHEV